MEGFRSQSADPTLPFILDNWLLLASIFYSGVRVEPVTQVAQVLLHFHRIYGVSAFECEHKKHLNAAYDRLTYAIVFYQQIEGRSTE